MPEMSKILGKLESYSFLDPHLIRTTKISKVLKLIQDLTTFPDDEGSGGLRIQERATCLRQRWQYEAASKAENDNAL